MKHTPGPWKSVDIQKGYLITNSDESYDIAVVRNIGQHDNQANARLIAAAPELMEALYQLIDAADCSDDIQFGTLSTTFVRDIAIKAINKATGEQA